MRRDVKHVRRAMCHVRRASPTCYIHLTARPLHTSNYVHCGYTHAVKTEAESRRLVQMLDLARAKGLAPRKV